MIKVICIIFGIQGGLLIAAAKSLFVTKKQIYDKNGITIFVTRPEWVESRDERERRRDQSQRYLCEKMDKLQLTQDDINKSLNQLLGKLGKGD